MKRIYLYGFYWLVMMTANVRPGIAQEAKTPTKLETMDWIAGKLKQYIRQPKERTFISYSNGVFVYEKRFYNCERTLVTTSKNTINLNKVTDYTICGNKPVNPENEIWCGNSEIIGQNLIYTATTHHLSGKFSTSYGNSISIDGDYDPDCDPYYNATGDKYTLFNFDLEAGLLTRMQKALKALIKYNTVKSGEAW